MNAFASIGANPPTLILDNTTTLQGLPNSSTTSAIIGSTSSTIIFDGSDSTLDWNIIENTDGAGASRVNVSGHVTFTSSLTGFYSLKTTWQSQPTSVFSISFFQFIDIQDNNVENRQDWSDTLVKVQASHDYVLNFYNQVEDPFNDGAAAFASGHVTLGNFVELPPPPPHVPEPSTFALLGLGGLVWPSVFTDDDVLPPV